MSVQEAETQLSPLSSRVTAEPLPAAGDWLHTSDRQWFTYDELEEVYTTNLSAAVAPALARLVLEGIDDHETIPHVAPLATDSLYELVSLDDVDGDPLGLLTDDPRLLYTGLSAATRLEPLTITERELTHQARADFVDFLHGLALQGIVR